MGGAMSKHYCNSKDLEEWWTGWLLTNDDRNWDQLTQMLFTICVGISKKFHPKSDEEHNDLANEAMLKLMAKIKAGKLKFKPTCEGGSPVFNLLTTTIHRILCSHKNQIKNEKIKHAKYVVKVAQEKAPELMKSIKDELYDQNM
jgi:hypothetical protein